MRSSALLGGGVNFITVAGQASYPLAGLPAPPALLGTAPQTLATLPVTPPLLGGIWNNGNELAVQPGPSVPVFIQGPIPTAPPTNGGLWSNGGVIAVAPGPDATLSLALWPGLLTLPTSPPANGGLWNDGNVIAVQPGPGATLLTIGSFFVPLGNVGIVPDSFGKWDRESFRTYTTATGYQNETFLDDIDFDTWRNSYMLGAMRAVQTRPVAIAVGPDQSLNLGPPPNGLYTVTGDYWVAPTDMVNDTDIPYGIPTRFHMLIVYLAMQKYAGYESAPEVMQRGQTEYARMNAQLLAIRAPRVSFGGALA